MNKIFIILFCIASLFTFSGCLFISQGYTPGSDVLKNNSSKKYAVTFSVDYLSDGDSGLTSGRASRTDYIKSLESELRASGYFSSVTYKQFDQKSNYHIHFKFHYSCMSLDDSINLNSWMGVTLLTLPAWVNMYLDASAVLYLNGEALYSPATAENLRNYLWLPFLPVCMVWNEWWAWTTQEEKCRNYLINEITNYQSLYL